jgi:hypothetical protein
MKMNKPRLRLGLSGHVTLGLSGHVTLGLSGHDTFIQNMSRKTLIEGQVSKPLIK